MSTLSEQIVHAIFNEALLRLGVKHISPLPVLLATSTTPAITTTTTTAITATLAVGPVEKVPDVKTADASQEEHKDSTTVIAMEKKHPPPPPTEPKQVKKKSRARPKRQRPNDDQPIILDEVLSERHELYSASHHEQTGRDLPTKRYSCTNYAPEFVEWLDRVVKGSSLTRYIFSNASAFQKKDCTRNWKNAH